jgi:hypothetical protein
MKNEFSRRDALRTALFGAGMLGLRSLATGLPAAILLNPRKALAQSACPPVGTAQFVILNTSVNGDPINCNCPGTYLDPAIVHSPDPTMAPASLTLRGTRYTAAAPWATLPQNVLDRTAFFHVMTNTPVHPKEPDVLRLMDANATEGNEMFPSIIAKQLAPCLGTIQTQPISIGAANPSETMYFGGSPLPVIPPSALKATLVNPAGALTNLQKLRDESLASLYDVYKNSASPAQQAYVDSLVTSTQQVRGIRQDLLAALSSITDNSPASQILAAITLIQMNVSPVVAVHIPFGGDNHSDPGFKTEATQTVSGVQTIASLMSQLAAAGLADKVTFLSLNVFGRTMGPSNTSGRQHNPNHQVSLAIGKPFKGGVIGGVTPVDKDYGAQSINSTTGAADPGGDISALASLGAFAMTTLAGLGVPSGAIASQIAVGKVIAPALA